MIYLIIGKPFAFSSQETAEKFREEYAPYVETKIGIASYLSLPESRYKIVPTEKTSLNVYDTIEDCLKDFPQEKYFKYINERKKVKTSISLKYPLVFNDYLRMDNQLKTNKVGYQILKDIVKRGNEELKFSPNASNENAVVTRVQLYENGGKNDPSAPVTVKQLKEMQTVLADVEEKLKKLKKDFEIAYLYDDENELY